MGFNGTFYLEKNIFEVKTKDGFAFNTKEMGYTVTSDFREKELYESKRY